MVEKFGCACCFLVSFLAYVCATKKGTTVIVTISHILTRMRGQLGRSNRRMQSFRRTTTQLRVLRPWRCCWLLVRSRGDGQIFGMGAFQFFCASIFRWSRCQSESTGWKLTNTFAGGRSASVVLESGQLFPAGLLQEILHMAHVISKALQISKQYIHFTCQISFKSSISVSPSVVPAISLQFQISKRPRMRNVDKNLRTITELGWLTPHDLDSLDIIERFFSHCFNHLIDAWPWGRRKLPSPSPWSKDV